MKNHKKFLSLLTVLSMVAIMFSVVPMQVSAVGSGGDVVTDVCYTGTEWKNNLQSLNGATNGIVSGGKISLTSSTATYTVASDTNSGTDWWKRYILIYKNGQGNVMYLDPSTRYRISFVVSAQGTNCTLDKYAAQLTYMEYNAGTFPKLSTDTPITDLSPYAEQIAWATDDTQYNKYRITLTYDTPAAVTKGLLALSVYHNPNQGKPIFIEQIKWEHLCRYNVVDADTSASIGTLWGMPGDDVQTLLTAQGFARQGHSMSPNIATTAAGTTTINVTYTEVEDYKIYDVIDGDTGEKIGEVLGKEDDDVYELLENAGLTRTGYEMEADPEFIESDTEEITVTYNLFITDVQVIKFDETYGGGTPDWHYISDSVPDRHVELSEGAIKHDSSTSKPAGNTIGQHSVVLANSYSNSSLTAGSTYKVSFDLKTFPRWTPLENLGAYIRFGQHIWDSNMIDSAMIQMTGEDLATAVTSYSASSTGSVTFRISLYVTLPETGWTSTTARNIILAIYGGEYWLDNVNISTTAEFDVVDEVGASLGKAYGLVGDSTASLIDSSLVGDDYTFTTSPATISTFTDKITLTKTLKPNIAQKIDFGSDVYLGNSGSDQNYYAGSPDGKLAKSGSVIVGTGVNSGNAFGNRSIVLANNRWSSGLVAENTYRAVIKFSSWYELSAFKLDVKFGKGIWNTMETGGITGASISDKVTTIRALGSNSGIYLLNIDFTVPAQSAWETAGLSAKDIIISLYGTTARPVDYQLFNAYIYKPTTVTVNSYDGLYTATVLGYEGNSIGSVVSDDGTAKFLNVAGKFGLSNQSIQSGLIIYRGDANADFSVNAGDLTMTVNYLLGKSEAESADLFGLNVIYGAGNEGIDIRDLIALKKMLINPENTATGLPAGLHYNDYEAAWNYEFNDATISSSYFDRQYGHNRNLGDIETVGGNETQYSYSKDGMLVIAPSDNYGAGKTIACDAITTKTTMKFTYGYLEINAKLPFSSANAPAFWLKSSPEDSSDPTFEIDLLETFGSTNSISTNLHCWVGDTDYSANAVNDRTATILDTDTFHKYGFEWYKENGVSKIAFYVDGNLIKTMSKSDVGYDADFNQEMYIILENVPITEEYYESISDWALNATAATHSDYPMNVCIDYVRLYQSASNSGNTITR